jgi:hypothetical protein
VSVADRFIRARFNKTVFIFRGRDRRTKVGNAFNTVENKFSGNSCLACFFIGQRPCCDGSIQAPLIFAVVSAKINFAAAR